MTPQVFEDDGTWLEIGRGYPAVPRPSGRRPFTFGELAALVVIAASVGFLAGVALALVLG